MSSMPRRRLAPGVARGRMRPRIQVATTPAKTSTASHPRVQTIGVLVTAVTAIGALVFTGLSLNATQQGQYTDRYTKAIEQLGQQGPDRLQVRLGGIYALERLARDSPRDQPTIIEVLSAFVRTSRPAPTAPDLNDTSSTCPVPQPLAPDARTALIVLSRRDRAHDNNTRTDLTGICLNGVDLGGVSLNGVDLGAADLRAATLRDVDLRGAHLVDAHLQGAHLQRADLRNADLHSADVRDTSLRGADLRDANLDNADLRGADLSDVDLYGANLFGIRLTGAILDRVTLIGGDLRDMDLHDVDLSAANLHGANLQGANLQGANLPDADLSSTNLLGADLRGANLRRADLSDADLRVVLSDSATVVEQATTDTRTIGRWW